MKPKTPKDGAVGPRGSLLHQWHHWSPHVGADNNSGLIDSIVRGREELEILQRSRPMVQEMPPLPNTNQAEGLGPRPPVDIGGDK